MKKVEMKKVLLGFSLSLFALTSQAQEFRLKSRQITQDKQIADAYVQNGSGCSGGNKSPELSWEGAPASTKSFAVTVYDPDAPTGSGWWHWTVVNIPRHINSLPVDAGNRDSTKIPFGAVQGRTDFGSPGYGGPCPPQGNSHHHYHFKVWALKVDKLPIDNESSGAIVGYLLKTNEISSAELVPISAR